MCVAWRCRGIENNALSIDQFRALLLNCFLSFGQLLIVKYRIDRLTRFQNIIVDNSLPIPPYTQHHLTGRQSGLCSRLCHFTTLQPRSFAFNVLVFYPFFIARYYSLKNGSISLRFNNVSQISIRLIKFRSVNSNFQMTPNCLIVHAQRIIDVLTACSRSIAISCKISSAFSVKGRPEVK